MPAGQRKTLLETVKANPVISGLAAVALIATTITGAITGLNQMDSLVMTHAEHDIDIQRLDLQHAAESEQIEELKLWNQCDRLERRIDALEDRLWRTQQNPNADDELIRDIENDIEAVEQQFRALNCAEILAG